LRNITDVRECTAAAVRECKHAVAAAARRRRGSGALHLGSREDEEEGLRVPVQYIFLIKVFK
jgi:hypothetical protein